MQVSPPFAVSSRLLPFAYYPSLRLFIKLKHLICAPPITDLIRQVSQLLRAELEELVDEAWATIKLVKLCNEK